MKKCSHCGKNHDISYHLKDKIPHGGFPRSQKKYATAHKLADIAEKDKYPSGYERMKKVDAHLPKKQDAGTSTKSGKIEISRKVPPFLRKEVAFHEKIESKKLKGK